MADAFKAITAGKAAIDGLKTLAQYADEVKDTQKRGEFMRVIGELSIELAETQIRLAEQLRENIDLRQEVDALKKENERLRSPDSKPVLKDGLYFVDDNPICTGCYNVIQKSIPVTRVPEPYTGGNLRKYECPHCRATYLCSNPPNVN